MSTGTAKRRNDGRGERTPKLTPKRVVDFLLAMAVSDDLPSPEHSQRLLFYTATKTALELGASQSKIDSLMMFYSDNLGNGNVVLGGFLNHIETLGPRASRKTREAAVKSMVRVGAHRRARVFAREYLRRSLTEEEFTTALEVHCNSMYSTEEDQKMILWASEFSQTLADEVAAKLEERMKAAGYSSK